MSAKLFNEHQQSERPQHKKTIKKIDDLILDAEIEAQAEINQKIRSNNTRTLLLILVGVGLFYVLYSGVQNETISIPSFLTEETQVAKAPPEQAPTPIPFPVTESATATGTAASPLNEPQEENLSPLENEVMSMIQKNLGEPGAVISALQPEPAKPSQQDSLGEKSTSPFAPEVQTPLASAVPASPALSPASASKKAITAEPSTPKSTVPQLTAAQGEFFIQVGAFSVKTNADRVIKKLMSGGFSPLVQTRTTRPSMHVVFIGGFADKQSPQNMITELRNKGLSPTLKKNVNGSYSVILGKERSKARAEALKQKLTKQGIFTSMKQMKIDMRMFIVRVEGFDNNTNALRGQKRLEILGYKGTLIRKKS
jgi:cell division septation protein DedD